MVTLSAGPGAGATAITPVTLIAAVGGVPGIDPPAGTVNFAGPGVPAACTSVALSGGSASCPLGDLAAGTYSFTASYSGDGNYLPGPPATVASYVVSLAPTALAIAPSAPGLASGQPAQLTATITSGGSPVTGGSVQWEVDGSDVGAAVPVGADGTATLDLPGLAAGSHSVAASYSGTETYARSSDQVTVPVTDAFSGFLSPLPRSSQKSGSTLPVKFTLTNWAGTSKVKGGSVMVTAAPAGAPAGTVATSAICAYSSSAAAWQCNLKMPAKAGTYQILVLEKVAGTWLPVGNDSKPSSANPITITVK
jgi:hypothetical protein